MPKEKLIRDYENTELSKDERIPSLAKRFSSLQQADGLKPWHPATFHAWVAAQPQGGATWHAGHFVLNLYGKGPWESFDAIAARKAWSDAERALFANWVKSWKE